MGEFYSLAITSNYQQADTGTKMIHLGRNTKSRIVSKSVSALHGNNSFRGLVKVIKKALWGLMGKYTRPRRPVYEVE